MALVVAFQQGFFATACLADESVQVADKAFNKLKQEVQRIVLPNGLKILFLKRETAPVFSGQVWVKVGGVNEVPGNTGASHMLEHMAFKGTETVGTKNFAQEKPLLDEWDALMREHKSTQNAELREQLGFRAQELEKQLSEIWNDNEFSSIYERAGASGLNAATSKDYTFYLIEMPSVAFELWCWMESERILRPVFRQFYKERDVVLEERRMRVDDDPAGMAYENLLGTAFLVHPNRLPVIGYADDVQGLLTKDVRSLHQQYYRPDNMVISIVGNLDLKIVRPMLEKYFGRIPKASGELPTISLKEPPQKGERQVAVEFDAEPQVLMAWHKPVYPDPVDAQFAVLHAFLSDGRSSLLYDTLVRKERLASRVLTTEAPGELYSSLFIVAAYPVKGVSPDRLRNRIQELLDEWTHQVISEKKLAEAKRRLLVSFLDGLSTSSGLSTSLAHGELLWGDWQVMLEMFKTMNETTSADLQSLIRTFLSQRQRTTVVLSRAGTPSVPGQGATGRDSSPQMQTKLLTTSMNHKRIVN